MLTVKLWPVKYICKSTATHWLFYRPPNRDQDYVHCNLWSGNKYPNTTVWIGGDLNLPDIDWSNDTSPLRLFPDDCLLYRVIDSQSDAHILQQDLDRLSNLVTQLPFIATHKWAGYRHLFKCGQFVVNCIISYQIE